MDFQKVRSQTMKQSKPARDKGKVFVTENGTSVKLF